MELNAQMMQRAYQYFDFDPDTVDTSRPFSRICGETRGSFLLGRKRIRSYDRYKLSSPILFSVIRCTHQQMTSIFLDLRSQFFYHEALNPQNDNQFHTHDYFELTYVVDGQLDLMIEDTRHRLLPGDAYIINANTRHTELRTTEYTVIYVGIKPDYLRSHSAHPDDSASKELQEFLFRGSQGSPHTEYLHFTPLESFHQMPAQDRFNHYFFILFDELLTREVGYGELCKVYIRRIFSVLQNPTAYICSNIRFQTLTGNPIFEQTILYLNECKRKVSRRELEEALRYNGNYISHVFQKQTGQTLAEYIRDICLNEAARLLLNSDMSVRDICHQVGYENKTVFYNLFKKKYGVTPQQYRQYEKGRFPT